ncbi:MAG TPA: amino acid adenylation domain-containing protein, partial [Roseiflexaceae bacterium]|nr:amino acid adenylation domain-containing protein [Roseiflexaceae bacterium]
ADAQRPFDLAEGPLLRAALLALADDDHILLLNMHHIISDGWSWGRFFDELTALYTAAASGTPHRLPPLPVQYADYALWQRDWLQGAVLDAQLDYWRAQLSDLQPLGLPTDFPRPAVPSLRGAHCVFRIDQATTQALLAQSRREGATLFMALLAVWQLVLARWSGQDDVAVGTPIAGRGQQATEGLIGCFVNTLVLRSDLARPNSFRELLAQVRETCLAAYAHQELPFEQLVDALAPERDLSIHPLFQVMFALQNTATRLPDLPGLALAPFADQNNTVKFDLSLVINEDSGGLTGVLEYSSDLFTPETIGRMAGHFTALLTAAASRPDDRPVALPMLTADELDALGRWGSAARHQTNDGDVLSRFRAQAAQTPAALALECDGETISFAALCARVDQLASALHARGVGANDRVALLLSRQIDLAVALLGVLAAGAAYVPVDPATPKQRLDLILDDVAAALVLTETELLDRLSDRPAELLCLDRDWPLIAAAAPVGPILPAPDDLAYIIYTSGSTGQPKGVMVAHRQLRHTLRVSHELAGLHVSDVALWIASVAFDITLFELLVPLLAGAQVRIVTRPALYGPDEWRALLATATVVHAVPSLLRQMVLALTQAPALRSPLRRIFVGGDAVPPDLLALVRATLPEAELTVLYGPTETTVICCSAAVDKPDQRSLLIGRPLPGVTVRVLDRHGQPVPVGVTGELYIGGAGVSLGYLNRPELHAERFVSLRAGEQNGERRTKNQELDSDNLKLNTQNATLYRTGDQARWLPDGTLVFAGRLDGQVKLRGFRIELGEIEA